jgi:hypothetical protein
MVTRTYPLDRVKEAVEDMLAGKNAKGVLTMNQESRIRGAGDDLEIRDSRFDRG